MPRASANIYRVRCLLSWGLSTFRFIRLTVLEISYHHGRKCLCQKCGGRNLVPTISASCKGLQYALARDYSFRLSFCDSQYLAGWVLHHFIQYIIHFSVLLEPTVGFVCVWWRGSNLMNLELFRSVTYNLRCSLASVVLISYFLGFLRETQLNSGIPFSLFLLLLLALTDLKIINVC